MIWVIGQGRFERAFREFYNKMLTSVDSELVKKIDAVTTIEKLQGDIATLNVTKSQIEEKYEKREREIEHKLGLERQRQEQELKLGLREQTVKVQEENLQKDRERFETQMKFTEKRFTEEVGYLKDMIKPLLEALPKMKISQKIE